MAQFDDLLIKTDKGRVSGVQDGPKMRVWRGLPYAEAPLGRLRFRAPQPHPPWQDIRDASQFGPIPLQAPVGDLPMSEDCLTLNIWSPPDAHGLPVVVWLHGGGFASGAGALSLYHGQDLAAQGPAVVVTLNYRLGFTGNLDFSGLKEAAGRCDSNLSLRDQIAALAWVQRNIAGFGGDPGNVTLGGDATGGSAALCLMASPLARGLFHAVIAHSPPAESILTRAQAATVMQCYLGLLDLPDASFDDIATLDPRVLVAAIPQLLAQVAQMMPFHHATGPMIDGEVLLDRPARAIRRGLGHVVPLLIGSAQDEGLYFAQEGRLALMPVVQPNCDTFLFQHYPDRIAQIKHAYAAHHPDAPEVAIGGDGMVLIPALSVAESLARHAPVYVYRFAWPQQAKLATRLRDSTSLGVMLVFWNLPHELEGDLRPDEQEGLQMLSAAIQAAWLGFARDRKPCLPGLLWPCYSDSRRQVLVLDQPLSVASDPHHMERRAWG